TRLFSFLSGTCWHWQARPSKLFSWYKSWYRCSQDQGFDKIPCHAFQANHGIKISQAIDTKEKTT
ncbi:hypothetical protein, partial [Thiolapillus sp.]|uniref:hypothetical protein n=1 Tax=Thiolapillus sp. TaxID=2017437 RepID=UPI003AF86E6A